MKKLMIAAAIVCATAMSQAASYEWNVYVPEASAAYKADGTSLFSGQAYVFNGETIDQESMFTALAAGAALDTLASTYNGSAITLTGGFNETPVKMFTDQTLGEEQTFMLVMKDGNNFFIDDQEPFVASTMEGGADVALDVSWSQGGTYVQPLEGGYVGGGWYTSAVPEPTSGLLLLLGVAGLALRRRRA